MDKVFIVVFMAGFSLSWGPCLSGCGPVLIPYLAVRGDKLKEILLLWFLFSFSRVAAYLAIVLLALIIGQGEAGELIKRNGRLIHVFLGSILLANGILAIFGKSAVSSVCACLKGKVFYNKYLGAVTIGFLSGMPPCLPFLGILAYILAVPGSFWKGMLLGSVFGLGTMFSPLFLGVVLLGLIPGILRNREKALRAFKVFSGILMCVIGSYFIVN